MFCIVQDDTKIIREGFKDSEAADRALVKLEELLETDQLMVMRTDRAVKMGMERSF